MTGGLHDHFIKYFHKTEEEFEKHKEYDIMKVNYAYKNLIPLVNINYKDFDNIECILDKELKFYIQ